MSEIETAIAHDLGNLVKLRTVSSTSPIQAENKFHRREMEKGIGFIADAANEAGVFPLFVVGEDEGFPYIIIGNQITTEPDIAFSAHLDVADATRRSFHITHDKVNYYGRGVADDKFVIAIYLQLLRYIALHPVSSSFAVIITCDEEVGGMHGDRHIIEDLGYKPKLVVLPDGGRDWNLAYRAKGGLYMNVKSNGKNAHAAHPVSGENAILQLIDFYSALGTMTTVPEIERWEDTTVVPSKIVGGESSNQVPRFAESYFDCRYATFEERERILQRFAEAAASVTVTTQGGIDVSLVYETRLFQIDPSLPDIQRFLRIAEEVIKRPLLLESDFGASNARLYQQYANAPSIVTMPPSGNLHEEGEWIERKGILQLEEILRRFITHFGSQRVNQS
jgi:succinyl-diaminopimelate desuccinylase